MKTLARPALRSAATSISTMAGVRIRALTERHPIKPTSPRCHSAWQLNLGRYSTYRRGKSVQTTGTTSVHRNKTNVNRYWKLDYPVIHPATSRGEKSFKASTSAWMNSSRRFISSTCSGEHSSNISSRVVAIATISPRMLRTNLVSVSFDRGKEMTVPDIMTFLCLTVSSDFETVRFRASLSTNVSLAVCDVSHIGGTHLLPLLGDGAIGKSLISLIAIIS